MTTPFVIPSRRITLNIGITPTLIFGNDKNTCSLESILITNQTSAITLVYFYILTEHVNGNLTKSNGAIECPFINYIELEPMGYRDVFKDIRVFYLVPGDLLYAYSNFSGNIFNSFVSYRELTETGVNNARK